LGIIIAYWINFAARGTEVQFRWRFPLGIMCLPVFLIVATVTFVPDSPRWLIAQGRDEEAIDVLAKVRGDVPTNDPTLLEEVEVLRAQVESSKSKRNSLLNMVTGRYSGRLHLGRRVWLGFWLQQIQQWTGILAIATWAGTLFSLAGFDAYKSTWLAGLVDTFGVLGTAAAALVVDRLGRVKSLIVSFITQGVALFLVAAFIRSSELSTGDKAINLGIAAAAMVFVFLWFFTIFNIVPCWIYGTEIWPQEIRAKGYSFTILEWAVGCGMNIFVIPIMLDRLGWITFIVFGIFNILAMPVIWFIYPEVAGKTLEEVNLLFASNSILASENVKEYSRKIEDAGGNLALASHRLMESVETEFPEDEEKSATARKRPVHIGNISTSSIEVETKLSRQ
jgi:hypothetical protein